MVKHMVEPARDERIERLFTGMVTVARQVHATGQRWTASDTDLTTAEAAVMRVVAHEGRSRSGAVAGQLGVGPSAVSRLVTALCERGLIERHPDPADGRAELLALTDLGRKTMQQRRSAYLERLRCRFGDWELDRLDGAADLLERLGALLAAEPPPDGSSSLPHPGTTTSTPTSTHSTHKSKDDA